MWQFHWKSVKPPLSIQPIEFRELADKPIVVKENKPENTKNTLPIISKQNKPENSNKENLAIEITKKDNITKQNNNHHAERPNNARTNNRRNDVCYEEEYYYEEETSYCEDEY